MILDLHSMIPVGIRALDKQPLGCCAAFRVHIEALRGSLMRNQSLLCNAEFTAGLLCFGHKEFLLWEVSAGNS